MLISPHIVVDIISNTLDKNEKPIESTKIETFCQRAYNLENHIYVLDPKAFGIGEFKKALLGTNKLKTHPVDNPLPYEPNDVVIFNNSILLFKDINKLLILQNCSKFGCLRCLILNMVMKKPSRLQPCLV